MRQQHKPNVERLFVLLPSKLKEYKNLGFPALVTKVGTGT